jgi:hypothetical protein
MTKRGSSVSCTSCQGATVLILCCGLLSFFSPAPATAGGAGEAQASSSPPPQAQAQAPSPPAQPSSPPAKEAAPETKPPEVPPGVKQVDHDPKLFRPDPSYQDKPYDPAAQEQIYGGKHLNKTARPWVEAGRHQYDTGSYDQAYTWFGDLNLATPAAMAFGDLRTAAAYNDNGVPNAKGVSHQATVATRLNLDLDLGITATERLHMFVRPFDKNGSFLRYDIDGKHTGFAGDVNFIPKTLFFEGDLSPISEGLSGRVNKLDLPFAVGLVPLFTQNGIWIDDAFLGGAFSIPARNSRALGISNMDLTFFTALDQVTTPAVKDAAGVLANHGTHIYGFSGFVDANRGYWEFGYGYVDASLDRLSYHNLTVAFTRRYRAIFSNSVRVITNLGQNPLPGVQKTAEGTLILIENSLISRRPLTLVPYLNLFAGFKKPQALARAADAGGVLKNVGINFETDGLTGFPLLDDRGNDSYGGALGIEYLFNLDRQIVVEVATVQRNKTVPGLGAQYALGVRFQQPLDNAWILRMDAMRGFQEVGRDTVGVRIELRRKF